jgi:hypothetical protein
VYYLWFLCFSLFSSKNQSCLVGKTGGTPWWWNTVMISGLPVYPQNSVQLEDDFHCSLGLWSSLWHWFRFSPAAALLATTQWINACSIFAMCSRWYRDFWPLKLSTQNLYKMSSRQRTFPVLLLYGDARTPFWLQIWLVLNPVLSGFSQSLLLSSLLPVFGCSTSAQTTCWSFQSLWFCSPRLSDFLKKDSTSS